MWFTWTTEGFVVALLVFNIAMNFTIGINLAELRSDHNHLASQFKSLAHYFKILSHDVKNLTYDVKYLSTNIKDISQDFKKYIKT